jgi:F-type H+-transporting ATPase subunit alpha
MIEITKQPQYSPLSMEKQVCIIYAGSNGFLNDIPVEQIVRFEAELYPFLESKHQDILESIRNNKAMDDTIKSNLTDALNDFKNTFSIKS